MVTPPPPLPTYPCPVPSCFNRHVEFPTWGKLLHHLQTIHNIPEHRVVEIKRVYDLQPGAGFHAHKTEHSENAIKAIQLKDLEKMDSTPTPISTTEQPSPTTDKQQHPVGWQTISPTRKNIVKNIKQESLKNKITTITVRGEIKEHYAELTIHTTIIDKTQLNTLTERYNTLHATIPLYPSPESEEHRNISTELVKLKKAIQDETYKLNHTPEQPTETILQDNFPDAAEGDAYKAWQEAFMKEADEMIERRAEFENRQEVAEATE